MTRLPLFTAPQDATSEEFGWFVYGSSLDFEALAAWCAEHGYHAPAVDRAQPARLPGYRLAFNVPSKFWGGLVASLVADDASSVEGVLIPVPGSALGFVRHKEGVLSGLFEERDAEVELPGGSRRACRVYLAAASRVVPEGAPAPRFLQTLQKGARERGLSEAWLSQLATLT